MKSDLTKVSTADLIAHNHFNDNDMFRMFALSVDGKTDLWECRKVKAADKPKRKTLQGLMGAAGTVKVDGLTDDGLPKVSIVGTAAGSDDDFRAKRVAQLSAHYATCGEQDVELPSIENFFTEYVK